MKDFTVKFCLSDSEYMTALRLVVGAVCAAGDVDIDGAEDMKVCVTESCLIMKNCGYDSVEVTLCCNGGVSATICGEGGKISECDNDFSLALVSALVSSCVFERAQGAISKIILKL